MKINSLIIVAVLFASTGFVAQSSMAQTIGTFGVACDSSNATPIRCGYFTEGYQDGANDARNNQDHDYKRYKSKYDDQYEDSYRAGYDRGYSSVKPYSRWTDKQKDTYKQGYDDGDDDKDKGISRLPRRYEGQYDNEYEAYYTKGYLDGYDQRERQYDVPVENVVNRRINNVRNFPANSGNRLGGSNGTLNWTGRVDNRVNIILQGGRARVQTIAGTNLGQGSQTISGALPRREAVVSLQKLDGRGTATILQQPNRVNNYTTIIQVYDSGRGADNYRLRISWQASTVFEAYSTGKLRWKGRVDGAVNIRISGADVEAITVSGRPVITTSSDIDGYLARLPGRISVRKLNGRGTATILEQPSRQNNYIAVVRIFDPKSSDDDYEIEVSW